MAEQFHECRKADPGAKHLRGIGMPELMRHDPGGEPDGMTPRLCTRRPIPLVKRPSGTHLGSFKRQRLLP
jgi:hypothetical protein